MNNPTEALPRVVTFRLGGTLFAVPVTLVEEIIRLQPIAVLPDAPALLLGTIRVRDEEVAVMDLARLLGQVPQVATRDTKVLVLRPDTGPVRSRVAVCVDQVLEVIEFQGNGTPFFQEPTFSKLQEI